MPSRRIMDWLTHDQFVRHAAPSPGPNSIDHFPETRSSLETLLLVNADGLPEPANRTIPRKRPCLSTRPMPAPKQIGNTAREKLSRWASANMTERHHGRPCCSNRPNSIIASRRSSVARDRNMSKTTRSGHEARQRKQQGPGIRPERSCVRELAVIPTPTR